MTTTENTNTIFIRRVFDLPQRTVWKAWTEQESLKKWWGPEGYSCPFCTIELIEGGKYLYCMRSEEEDDFWSTGIYKEIVPLKKLVMTDNFSDESGKVIHASALKLPGKWPAELIISISLEEKEGKTVMEFQHDGVPALVQEDCKVSWEQAFNKLEKNLK